MMNFKNKSLIILLLLISASWHFVTYEKIELINAGSSSSGDIPPPSGSEGDTSGGGAAGGMYFNYRIPLIFKQGPYAPSIITITAIQNGTPILFGYDSKLFPDNSTILETGEVLEINPRDEPNLINGSLIQSPAPIQITVVHNSTSATYDYSYAYSVLVMSMWGQKYQAPFDDLKAMIVAGFNETEITVTPPDGEPEYYTLPLIGNTLDIAVTKGTIIESNGPIGVVFYSLSTKGSYSFTGIPYYLWGKEYYILPPPEIENGTTNSLLTLTTTDEIEYTMQVFTNYENQYSIQWDETTKTSDLYYNVLEPKEYYKYVYSILSNYSLSVLYTYQVNNVTHLSAIQYIANSKMKWAELFFTHNFSTTPIMYTSVLEDSSDIYPLVAIDNDLYIDLANLTTRNAGSHFEYTFPGQFGFIGNGSFFTYVDVTPSNATKYNDFAFLLFPLNMYSYFDNTSTYFPSWYRFPNLNTKEVKIYPTKPTELRTLKLDIIVQNNGTIPSAPFWVTVLVNDTLKINQKLDGLAINETFSIPYKEFRGFGLITLNVSIYVDSRNQILELQEFDNNLELFIVIGRNWNVIYTGITIATLTIGFIAYRLIRKLYLQSKKKSREFDLVVTDIEV